MVVRRGKKQIVSNAHVREQSVILKNVTATAVLRRAVYICRSVKIQLIMNKNAASIRADKSCQTVQCQCLPRAAGAKQNGDADISFQVNIQLKSRCFASRRQALN